MESKGPRRASFENLDATRKARHIPVTLLQGTPVSRLIRVDNEVYEWLQRQANPFEDTPNTVLRRLADLNRLHSSVVREEQHVDADARKVAASVGRTVDRKLRTRNHRTNEGRITGAALNAKYNLGAAHALYHRDGTWYERLERFPGILCDPYGFVRYDSERAFIKDSRLRIGRKVNVARNIASHPRYERFIDQASAISDATRRTTGI
jgi:hypothetical protein